MVGALARLAANSDSLDGAAGRFAQQLGLAAPFRNPMDNNKAQAVELVYDIECALRNVEKLLEEGPRPEPPVSVHPRAGTGTAATEAPRGLLFHSYTYDERGLLAADVITPTALNAASIENHLRRTVEQSEEKDHPSLTRKLEMVVRAYDPCISCSVHFVRKRHAV
jgi:coenzyme F420-reducing hydrogenase alpha subunit